jgi:hypothetical protein
MHEARLLLKAVEAVAVRRLLDFAKQVVSSPDSDCHIINKKAPRRSDGSRTSSSLLGVPLPFGLTLSPSRAFRLQELLMRDEVHKFSQDSPLAWQTTPERVQLVNRKGWPLDLSQWVLSTEFAAPS